MWGSIAVYVAYCAMTYAAWSKGAAGTVSHPCRCPPADLAEYLPNWRDNVVLSRCLDVTALALPMAFGWRVANVHWKYFAVTMVVGAIINLLTTLPSRRNRGFKLANFVTGHAFDGAFNNNIASVMLLAMVIDDSGILPLRWSLLFVVAYVALMLCARACSGVALSTSLVVPALMFRNDWKLVF